MVLDGIKYSREGSSQYPCQNGIMDGGENGIDCGNGCINYCYDKSVFTLDNKYSFITNTLEINEYSGKFKMSITFQPFEMLDPVPYVVLQFSAYSMGTIALDSTSYFAMSLNTPEHTTKKYYCNSGTVQVELLDTLQKIISLKYSFTGVNPESGRAILINNGELNNLLFRKQ